MKKHLCLTCLILVFLVGLHSAPATTTAVTLTWNRNPEPNIASYAIYSRQFLGGYKFVKSVTRPTATVYVRNGSTVFFAVTASNFAGLESRFSKEVRWR